MGLSRQLIHVWIPILFGIMGTTAADPSLNESQNILRDTYERIQFKISPLPKEKNHDPVFLIPPEDTAIPSLVAPSLTPPLTENPTGLVISTPPQLDLPWLSLSSPFSLNHVESLGVEAKVVRDFPNYWAQLEAIEDIDDLRQQLAMQTASGEATGIRLPGLDVVNGKVGINFIGLGTAFWQTWHKMSLEKERRNDFENKVNGLMGYVQDLGSRKNSGPAISLILARLDFMKKKVAGKLPARPERQAFTEPLKAWAVNPVFDSTHLGASLLNICGIYEEMTN